MLLVKKYFLPKISHKTLRKLVSYYLRSNADNFVLFLTYTLPTFLRITLSFIKLQGSSKVSLCSSLHFTHAQRDLLPTHIHTCIVVLFIFEFCNICNNNIPV